MTFDPDMELTQPGLDGWRPPQPAQSLLVYHHDGANLVPLAPGVPVVLGRGGQADVVCRGARLSRRHARFQLIEDKVLVHDLASTNGTFVNGQPALGPTIVSVGDEVGLGSVVVTITALNPVDGQHKGIEGHDRFMERLRDEVTRSATFGRSTALIMIREVDDEARQLHRWASAVRDHVRTGVDRVGLYEPRQIGVILAEATNAQATEYCERVRAAVDDDQSLAFGIAVYPMSGRSIDRLLAGANRAVNSASMGRPIVVANPHTELSIRGLDDEDTAERDPVVVRSPAMKEIYTRISQVAPAPVPVLILGETGTGKEVVARALHEQSTRNNKPMLTINCGAVAPSLIESSLFGHEKGSFTGANRTQKGVFEAADGGTVFLDEIGELALPAQAALLRVLDTGKVVRVGSSKEVAVDVRIVAATNRDLDQMVLEKAFRLDLLHRINMISVRLPPLRERLSEVIPLAQHFMHVATSQYQRNVQGLHTDVVPLLMKYHWPGNVRELRNVIERAVLIALGDVITTDDLPRTVRDAALMRLSSGDRIPKLTMAPSKVSPSGPHPRDDEEEDIDDDETQSMYAPRPYKEVMAECEHALISAALRVHDSRLSDAARALGMPRRTLAYKVKTQAITADRDLKAVETLTRWSNATEKHGDFKARMDQVELRLISRALQVARGDASEAARVLEIDKRTMAAKIEKYGIEGVVSH